MGALSGDLSQLVVPGYQAAELAFELGNAGAFGILPVKLELVPEDTAGLPGTAAAIAEQIASDPEFVGVIGPAFSGESQAAGEALDEAAVPFMTPSATNPGLADNSWTHWFRAVANDDAQGAAAAQYIRTVLGPNCTFVLSDGSTYGDGLAAIVSQDLQKKGAAVRAGKVLTPGRNRYAKLAGSVGRSGCGVVFYGGYAPEAARIRKQLSVAGVRHVTLVGGDGIRDASFLAATRASGRGTVATCPCANVVASAGASARAFIARYTERWGEPPGIYSAEAWDVAQMYLAAIKSAKVTRVAITDFFRGLSGFRGLTKTYTFEADGELADASGLVYIYRDEGENWAYLGQTDQVPSNQGTS